MGVLLFPVLTSPILPTTDGPSHLYNVAVAEAVAHGAAPYAQYHELGPAVGANRTASGLLQALHALLPWRTAEKTLVGFIILATFSLCVALLATDSAARAFAIVVAAWISQNWFLWSGFYDFALSIALFSLLSLIVHRVSGSMRVGLSVTLLVALFPTHLFTFAVGVALVCWVLVGDLVERRHRISAVVGIAACVALLILARQAGGLGGAAIGWDGKWKALIGALLGDVIVSVHLFEFVAGMVLMGVLWLCVSGVVYRSFLLRRIPWGTTSAAAAALLLFSLVSPESFHEGSYIGARLRALALVCMLPSVGEEILRIPRTARAVATTVLMTALVVHAGALTARSRQVARDMSAMEWALRDAGARPGSFVTSVLNDNERGLLRISAYLHLVDRVALENGYVEIDNYESRQAIFRVKWRVDPGVLEFRSMGKRGWAVSARCAAVGARSVFVVHERERPLTSMSGCLIATVPIVAGDFGVTELRLPR